MAQFIYDLRDKYGSRNVTFEEYISIMNQFSTFDSRCQLDDNILNELYQVLMAKQTGEVTYPSIEILVFEFLIQQPLPPIQIDYNNLGVQAQKLPKELLELINAEILQDLSNFHKYLLSKQNKTDQISYSEIENIGKAFQNQLKLEIQHLLVILSFLKSEDGQVSFKNIVQLIIDLEKMLYGQKNQEIPQQEQEQQQQQQYQQQKQQQQQQQQSQEIIHLSSDDEAQQKQQEDSSKISKSFEIPNLIYIKMDQLKQSKHLKQQEQSILKDIVALIQELETKAILDQEELEDKQKKLEEFSIERQLIQSRFLSDDKAKQEQIKMFIEENDYLANELDAKQETIDTLQEQIKQLQNDARSLTQIETIAKQRQIELDRIKSQQEEQLKESQRLQENNKTLVDIINQLEKQQDSMQDSQNNNLLDALNKNAERLSDENEFLKQELEELQNQLKQERNQVNEFELIVFKLEEQLKISQRDATNFRMLLEQRQSVMPTRNSMRASINRQSTFNRVSVLNKQGRISNIGGYNRVSNIGRLSQFNRISNIGRISQQNMSQFSQYSAFNEEPQKVDYPVEINENNFKPLNQIQEDLEDDEQFVQNVRLRGEQNELNKIEELDDENQTEQTFHMQQTESVMVKDDVIVEEDVEESKIEDSKVEETKIDQNKIKESEVEQQDEEQRDKNQALEEENLIKPDAAETKLGQPVQRMSNNKLANLNTLKVDFADFWDQFVGVGVEEGEKPAKKYKPQYNPEYVFLQFDENILYEKDFQGMRDKTKIKDIMEKEKLKYGKILQKCFSDQIFRIDAKGNKARRILYITEFNLYIFDEKTLKIRYQFPLEAIHTIIFLETSPILCCLKLAESYDYLFETFKRSELAEYLKEFCSFKLEFKSTFTVYFKGLKKPKKIEDLAKGLYVSGGKQSAFKISQKQGFLQFYSKKRLFSKDWQEVFVVLCEVGLILFEKPGELKPLLFVPIADALIIKNPKNVEKQHSFKIQYSSSDIEFCFSAISAALLDEWNDMIHEVIINRVKSSLKKHIQQ